MLNNQHQGDLQDKRLACHFVITHFCALFRSADTAGLSDNLS